MIAQILATFACGVFFGAAVYINLVEQPARISCGMHLAVTQWRPSYKRATLMQAPLALIGSLAALIAWRFEGSTAWLVGGLILLLVVPFTLVVILPTDKRLESQELDLRSEVESIQWRGAKCRLMATYLSDTRTGRLVAEACNDCNELPLDIASIHVGTLSLVGTLPDAGPKNC